MKVLMDKLAVKNLRNWGEVWLGVELWKRLGLDEFWAPRLEPGRKGTDWLAILKSIEMYRLTTPGSELRMHSSWMAETAVAELLGTGALVLTPDGFPLAYGVLPGNTSDKGTQMVFVRKLEAKHGRIGNLWLMDRGVPTEETLREMCESRYHSSSAPTTENGLVSLTERPALVMRCCPSSTS